VNRRRDLRAALVVALIMLVGALWGRRAAAMVPADVLTLRKVAVADLSPDGNRLLYTLTAWAPAGERFATRLVRRDLRTGEELIVFTPADRARGAVWRPDGQAIAYVREGDGGDEIWVMDADGGDRRRRAAAGSGASALRWSPDGSALAWIAPADVGDYDGVPGSIVVADDLTFRNLNRGYREGRLGQLFVLSLASGAVTRLLDDELDVREFAWSPDGVRLVFSAKAAADVGRTVNTDLWLVARDGSGPWRLTDNPGADASPVWFRPDAVAYLRATDPLWESAPNTVAVIDPDADAAPADAVPALYGDTADNLIRGFAVHDGAFYVLLARRGCIDLARLEGRDVRLLTDGGHDFWSVHAAGGRAVLAGAGMMLPGALFTLDLAAGKAAPPRLLLDPNAAWEERVGLTEPERFSVKVDGRRIEGWFFKPADLAPGQKAPLVLSIHGGPEWMYGGYFLPEFHVLPRFGYGVVIANPTGSLGYGTQFQADIRGDWVDRPGRELMACVDLAVSQGWADPERLAVMGGSYGGHLGAALTTQTDRFRAAALDRMFPDPVAFWGTTDEKWFPEWEFGGRPWDPDAAPVYRRNSPFAVVARVTTPTLVSHGGRDYRCLAAGGEMWFSALQALGVPSRYLRFQDEGHGLRDPRNQAFYLDELLGWFDRWVLGAPGENGTPPYHE